MLEFGRASVDFRKASKPQQEIIDEPPFETNGNVTPVSGKRSTVPKTFRIILKTSRDVAAQAVIV